MNTFLSLSACLLLFVTNIYSQSNFEIIYGDTGQDAGLSVQQTFDGKYIVTGSTATSGNTDVFLSLIDTNGTVLWTKTYGDSLEESGNSVIQTPDSGFAIVGYTYSFGNGAMDVYLIRTNGNGDTLWTKTFGGSDYDFGNMIINTFDGGFMIAGQEGSTGGGIAHIYLVKTDASGDTMWTKSFPMGAWTGASGIVQTPDSGYIVCGDFENNVSGNGDYDLVWMKTDLTGNLLWTKTLVDTTSNNYAQSIRQTFDGGFILGSETESLVSFSNSGSEFIKLDANGDTLWTKPFGLNFSFTIRDFVQTPDSGFVCTGYKIDTILSANILALMKMDSLGDSLWTKYYNGLYSSTGYSIGNTSDGGFIICGNTGDSALVQSDVYVIKTNGGGDLLTCQPLILTSPQDQTIYELHDTQFILTAYPQATGYQWQTDSAGIFVDIHDSGFFSGTNADTLNITAALLTMDGNQFRCIVSDSLGCADTSIVVTLHVNTSIGISSIDDKFKILYPNPATQYISISGEVPEFVILYDIYGKTIGEFKGTGKIDISFLPNGIYYFKLSYKNSNGIIACKFLKN